MPTMPQTETVIPTSEGATTTYRYTFKQPDDRWYAADFDDAAWDRGPGGLGRTDGTIGTSWDTSEVWARRTLSLDAVPDRPVLKIWHDEDADVYINGTRILTLGGYVTDYATYEFDPAVLATGDNVIAIHCRQTVGGQYIDVGLDRLKSD